MHPVANQVEIPTEKISEVLERAAVPGFTGSVTVHLRVRPTAGFEVEFITEKLVSLQINKPSEPEMPLVTNARVAKVRRMLTENRHRFFMGTKLSKILANFTDGELRKFELIEVE